MSTDFLILLGSKEHSFLTHMLEQAHIPVTINQDFPDLIFTTPDMLQEALDRAIHGTTMVIVSFAQDEDFRADMRRYVEKHSSAARTVYTDFLDVSVAEDLLLGALQNLFAETAVVQQILDTRD